MLLRLPVGILIVSQSNVASSQSVFGTVTTVGEITKLVSIVRPPNIAPGGTLIAFPICAQPYTKDQSTMAIFQDDLSTFPYSSLYTYAICHRSIPLLKIQDTYPSQYQSPSSWQAYFW